MTTFIYLVSHDIQFARICNTGWGNGYVAIPMDHPFVKQYYTNVLAEEAHKTAEDENYSSWTVYAQHPEFNQEITYTQIKVINDQQYLVIGFDTAHSFNGPHHDMSWVLNETLAMQVIVDSVK